MTPGLVIDVEYEDDTSKPDEAQRWLLHRQRKVEGTSF